MSLLLEQDTRPHGRAIKTGTGGALSIADTFIGPKDMVALVEYWLTNEDLNGEHHGFTLPSAEGRATP